MFRNDPVSRSLACTLIFFLSFLLAPALSLSLPRASLFESNLKQEKQRGPPSVSRKCKGQFWARAQQLNLCDPAGCQKMTGSGYQKHVRITIDPDWKHDCSKNGRDDTLGWKVYYNQKKKWAQWKNNNDSKKSGGSEPVNSNLHGGFVHEIALSEVEDPRQHDSEHLSGCNNPEVCWGKVMTFAHIWSWLKD